MQPIHPLEPHTEEPKADMRKLKSDTAPWVAFALILVLVALLAGALLMFSDVKLSDGAPPAPSEGPLEPGGEPQPIP